MTMLTVSRRLMHTESSRPMFKQRCRQHLLKGFIERIPHTNTYRVTAHGLRIAAFFTQLAARVVIPALTDLAALSRPRPPAPRPLTAAWKAYERELTNLLRASPLAA